MELQITDDLNSSIEFSISVKIITLMGLLKLVKQLIGKEKVLLHLTSNVKVQQYDNMCILH